MKLQALFKRALAMVLVVLMVCSVMPLSAVAEEMQGNTTVEGGVTEGGTTEGGVTEGGTTEGDGVIGDTDGELEEEIEIVGVPVSSLEELEEELAIGTEAVNLLADITLDHTIYITHNFTIYSETAVTILRAPEFGGDLFVVGQYADGTLCENVVTNEDGTTSEVEVVLTFGREEDEANLLTIDGNKDNVTASVVGSALFICKPGHVVVYESVNIQNHKKAGNERTSHENVTVSYPAKVGGAAAIVASGGVMDIYGGTFSGNEVNTVADENETCLQGGAIYNYGTLNIYGGTFDSNQAKFGGAFFNYRTMHLHCATISNNYAADLGGAIYAPNSTSAFTYIGEDAAGVEAHVSFIGNSAEDSGGAIYARNVIDISNAYFKDNSTVSGEGGAIIAYTIEMTMDNVIFDGNQSGTHGSAVYLSGSNEEEETVELDAKKVTFKSNSGKYGALYIGSLVRVTMEDAVFENNSGTYGGAIYNTGGTLEVNGATFTGNTSTTRGGALYSLETATVTLNNVTATGNTSAKGGFAYILGTTTKIYDSTFQNHTVTDSGAVLCLFSGAATEIYNCTFKDNTAANNAGVIQAYTDEALVRIHSSTFIGNTSSGYGGVIHASSKSQLELYCITATNNVGGHGGFLYITTTGTPATIGGLILSGNTATTGGNNIWGNSTGAKMYLDQSKCVENDYAGVRDDAYWSTFVTNKLKTYYQAVEVPSYINYHGEEIIPNVPIIPQDVTTAEELEEALASDNGTIRLMADITLDRTLYVTKNTTIFGVSSYTITRAADFAGDLFVVGQYADGTLCEEGVTLTLGREEGTQADHLIIDGNKDNLTVDVVGSAIFVCNGATVNLTKEVTLQNHKKVGNERTSHENVTVSYPVRVGGAAAIIASGGTMNIYGSTFRNNEVNTVSDDAQTCVQGGAIYNYGTTNVYGGLFEGNTAHFGGVFFNYRRLNIYNATIQNNSSTDLGGAIYMPNSTGAYTNIGTENDVIEPNVVFSGNTGGDDGGAIYARNVLNIANTRFENNSSKGYGGAIIAQTVRMTLKDVVFSGNSSTTTGGALYVAGSNGKEQIELSAENVTFENNSGTGGGAVYVGADTRTYFKNATFTGNSGTNGGSIYVKGASLEIDGATFNGNTATTKAAGIYATQNELDDGTTVSSTVVLNKINAVGNSAVDCGFAYFAYSDTEIYASHFAENTASASTAVIYLATGANTKIYGSLFENNEAAKNGGVITSYATDATVLIQNCEFLNNTCHGYGGVLHVSGKTQLTMYDIIAKGNSATHGGFMYETTAGTVVKLVKLTVDDNTASTGGPIIWGNTLNAKLYIDKSKMNDLDNSGAYDDAYWATAIVNKLTVYDISEEVPKYLDYNNEPYPNMQDAIDVSSSAELEAAINAGTNHIRVVADFELDRTFYITEDVTIFSTFPYTLTRATNFGGDIFVVGEFANGEPSFIKKGTCTLTLGNPDSVQENLLTIDGNKDNMAVPVVGTVVFIGFSAHANLHKNLTVVNAHKNGNERVYDERYIMKPDARVGGSVAIVVSGILNVYGGNYLNNEVNPVTQAEDGSYVYDSTYGGAIFNYNVTRVYGGNFAGNFAYHGGAIYNYQTLEITGGVFENNHATGRGGAIYAVDSAGAHTLIGTIPEEGKSEVTFRGNSSDSHGGVIYSGPLSATVIYEGSTFDSNYSATSGGVICTYGQFTVYGGIFTNNIAANRGGVAYFSYNSEARPVRYLKFVDCVFENNQGYYGGVLSSYAGSAEYATGAIAEVIHCTFTNNHAVKQTVGTSKACGGAIYLDRRSEMTVTDSTFNGNTAQLEGGALYASGESKLTVKNCTIDGSVSEKHGGAITVRSSYFDMENSTVTNSQCANNGGAIYVSYNSNREMNSKVNITGCTISGNSTTGGYGGAIYATKRTLENEHPVLTIKDTDFNNNSAINGAGALYMASKLEAYLKNVNFNGNTALEGKGGVLYTSGGILEYDTGNLVGNSSSGNGGALDIEGSAVVVLNNLTATNNSGASGGFMYTKGATVTLYNSVLNNNIASGSGGAIYSLAALSVYDTTFDGNQAASNGGAVVAYTDGLPMILQDVDMLNNTASFGGAVYASGSALLDLYNVTAIGNSATKGGFMYETTTGTVVTLCGITLSGNTADEAPIIWGNSTGAVLKIDKQSYTDSDHSGAYDDAYWTAAIVNALTVEDVDTAIPSYSDYVARQETVDPKPATRPVVSVDNVFNLAHNSSDAAINATYATFPRLDNSSNFMSNSTTLFKNVNGGDVMVDTTIYNANAIDHNINFSQGMLIYQALLYKQAHPEEDVDIRITSYRFSVQAGLCINRNSRYFGYMRQMPSTLDYDQYGFVRIAYLLVTAAKMGVNVTVVGHQDAYPMAGKDFKAYFEYYASEPCDPHYVSDGKAVSDYLTFAPVDWTLKSKGGTDMMHLKLCAVSDYIDMNGVEHKYGLWTSSSNLDGITADGRNACWTQQTSTIITNHEDLYRVATNYVDLMTQYTGQEEIYEFQHILNYRSTKQVELFLAGKGDQVPADKQLVYVGSENDDVFELYFTPMGGGVLTWDETTNAYCKYIREMYESEDYIVFVWNAAEYTGAFGLGRQIEMMINASFHENKNVNNKVYMNTESFTGESFLDLKIGEDIGLKSFNQKEFGGIHNKDVHLSYVKNGQRYYVSLMNSNNVHSGSMYYQANHMLVIKETELTENSVYFTALDRTTSGIVEHAYGEEKTKLPTTNEHGYHYRECEVCGKILKLDILHNPGEWIGNLDSVQHRSCTVCGEMTHARSINANGKIQLLCYDDIAERTFTQDTDTHIGCNTVVTPHTFEAVIHLPTNVGGGKRSGVIIGNYTKSKSDQVNLEVYNNGKFRLFYQSGGKSVTQLFTTDVRSDEPQHLTLTVDGVVAKLYLNGILKETITLTMPLPATIDNLVIGGDHRANNEQYFRGSVSSVNLFADVRTAEEIMQDYRIVNDTTDNLLYSAYFGESEQIHLHTFDSVCDPDCGICGYEQETENHIYDNGCDVDCNACGEMREITHTYETVVTNPDCVNGGYTTYTCSVCGDSYVDNHVDALGHTYDNACDIDCNTCGEIREITHAYEAVITAPDCMNGGYTTYTCSVCGDSYVDTYVDALGHTYDNACDVDCNVCGEMREITHAYDAVVTDPDCVNDGYTTYTCTVCGDSYVDNHVDALGHNYIGVETSAPTCGADGEMTYTCDVCGDSYTEAISATGEHSYDHAYDADCNVCGIIRAIVLPYRFAGKSVSEDVYGAGLAFLFHTEIEGMAIKQGTYNRADFTNATFDGHKLVKMGAIASNGKSETNIEAVHVYQWEENTVSFAYRIINIPEDKRDTAITMTPYFVVEIDGQEVTIYGEAQSATYNEAAPFGMCFD